MRRHLTWFLILAVCLSGSTADSTLAQPPDPQAADEPQDPGQADLDQAVEAKVTARRVAELATVVDLCESALEKGLGEENTAFARNLLASTLVARAQAVATAIFERSPPDPRWPRLRRAALDDLTRALEIDPDLWEGQLLVGKLESLPRGDLDNARAALDEVARLCTREDNPQARAEALLLRAALATDIEAQLADLSEVIELQPENPQSLLARGRVRQAIGESAEALPDFDAALTLAPDDAAIHAARALVLAELGRLEEAKTALVRAAELAPQSAEVQLQLARLCGQMGDVASALNHADRCLELAPEEMQALFLRANLRGQLGEFDAAISDLSAILELRPGVPLVLRTRASLYVAAGRFDEALADLEVLKAQAPDNAGVWVDLGQIYAVRKESARALEAFNTAVRLDPALGAAYRGRADVELADGDQVPAIADYRKALELDPNDAGALNNLAWVLATSPDDGLRNGTEALELAKVACEITNYSQAHILSTLAAAYAETGDFASAVEWSGKAVAAADESVKERLGLELARYQVGKPWRELKGEPVGN